MNFPRAAFCAEIQRLHLAMEEFLTMDDAVNASELVATMPSSCQSYAYPCFQYSRRCVYDNSRCLRCGLLDCEGSGRWLLVQDAQQQQAFVKLLALRSTRRQPLVIRRSLLRMWAFAADSIHGMCLFLRKGRDYENDYPGAMPMLLQSNPFHAINELLSGQGIQDETCALSASNFLQSVFMLYADAFCDVVVGLPPIDRFTRAHFFPRGGLRLVLTLLCNYGEIWREEVDSLLHGILTVVLGAHNDTYCQKSPDDCGTSWRLRSEFTACDGTLLMSLVQNLLPILDRIVEASLQRADRQRMLHANCSCVASLLDPCRNNSPCFRYHVVLEILANLLMRPDSMVATLQANTVQLILKIGSASLDSMRVCNSCLLALRACSSDPAKGLLSIAQLEGCLHLILKVWLHAAEETSMEWLAISGLTDENDIHYSLSDSCGDLRPALQHFSQAASVQHCPTLEKLFVAVLARVVGIDREENLLSLSLLELCTPLIPCFTQQVRSDSKGLQSLGLLASRVINFDGFDHAPHYHGNPTDHMARRRALLENSTMQTLLEKEGCLPPDAKREWLFYLLALPTHRSDDIIQIQVSRRNILSYLCDRADAALPADARIWVTFEGEAGGGDGVTKEFFSLAASELVDADVGLFEVVDDESDSVVFPSRKSGDAQPDHLSYFNLAGRTVGHCLKRRLPLPFRFSRAFLNIILCRPITTKDLASVDPEISKSLNDLLESQTDRKYAISDIGITFTRDESRFGANLSVPLKPGGEEIMVTEESRIEFVNLYTKHVVHDDIEAQCEAFTQGFTSILPIWAMRWLSRSLSVEEFGNMLSGEANIDIQDWEQFESTMDMMQASSKSFGFGKLSRACL